MVSQNKKHSRYLKNGSDKGDFIMATNQKKTLINWMGFVGGKDFFNLDSYDYRIRDNDNFPNVYARFVSFIQDYAKIVVNGGKLGIDSMIDDRREFNNMYKAKLPENWWDVALKVGKGKKVENNPIVPIKAGSEITKERAYAMFMPAYRAIKESFDKRWGFLSWIFNHREYTAERDAMKVLSGLMQSLTGDTQQDIDQRLAQDQKDLVIEPETLNRLNESINARRKEHYRQLKERVAMYKKAKKEDEKNKNKPVIQEAEADEGYINEYEEEFMGEEYGFGGYNKEADRSHIHVDVNDNNAPVESKIEDSEVSESNVLGNKF